MLTAINRSCSGLLILPASGKMFSTVVPAVLGLVRLFSHQTVHLWEGNSDQKPLLPFGKPSIGKASGVNPEEKSTLQSRYTRA